MIEQQSHRRPANPCDAAPSPGDADSRRLPDRRGRFRRLLSRVAGGLWGRRRARPAPSPAADARDAWLAIPDAVACPICGAVYVGEGYTDAGEGAHEDEGWEAIDLLTAECPDHRDYFVVGI